MAPPTSSKGSNPAPDFNLFMNKIQMQVEASKNSLQLLQQHRAAAAAFTARRTATAAAATQQSGPAGSTAGGGSFSSLQKASTSTTAAAATTTVARGPKSQQQQADRLAQLAAEEAEFADDRASDVNAGVGFARPKGSGLIPGMTGDAARDRDTKALRGRLLGGRRDRNGAREDPSSAYSRRRKYGGGGDSSEDDEPGRSGLGREKKRSHSEVEAEEEDNGEINPVKTGELSGSSGNAAEADVLTGREATGVLSGLDEGPRGDVLASPDGQGQAKSDKSGKAESSTSSANRETKGKKKKRRKNGKRETAA
ncbi:uncharacterized protein B0I36DRAFT_10484 [Microdochium trichocladiopsis]|uniref:Uncharacterized protein n=1 Tax=Microdochium trichocladiopsis TaxID=1682393 RepID=A0A9P8YHE9_9PEZI|nr:uncharacterized protein B0I36DRAFT_10484 [Microdochium trichocladiopsis]KAH7040444.1 hypothetical protein B0I36DRAFT_10484 [Microdochium trichocladiopsis]